MSGESVQEGDIDLRQVVSAIWKGKLLIVFTTLLFTAASVFYAYSLPNKYKSTVILSPTSGSGSSALSKLAGRLGGLASFAGVNVNQGGGEDRTKIALKLLTTWNFLEQFIRKNNLEVELVAVKGWDKSRNKLIIDDSKYSIGNEKWGESFSNTGPTSWALYKELLSKINIVHESDSDLVYISVESLSPFLAEKWVTLLVSDINDFMRLRDRAQALESIEYLKTQVFKTDIAEMQSVFYQLIEEQTKTLMLTEINEEYVFRTLSDARVAEQKSSPRRGLIIILSTSLGFVFSVLIVVLFGSNKEKKISVNS